MFSYFFCKLFRKSGIGTPRRYYDCGVTWNVHSGDPTQEKGLTYYMYPAIQIETTEIQYSCSCNRYF